MNNTPQNYRTPKLTDRFINIYKPEADIYSLPTVTTPDGNFTYIQGETYQNWRTNDHTFIRDHNSRWHCFGITKPWEAGDNSHSAEGLCFHAIAPAGTFAQAVQFQSWKDWPKIFLGNCGWAPTAIKIDQEYNLVGSNLGRATSTDLQTWTDRGTMNIKGGNRDPHILFWNDTYYFLRCDGNGINLVTSTDFINWTDPITIFKPENESYQTESPFLLPYKGLFYLFWTLWDQDDLSTSGYCPRSYVYCSESPSEFNNKSLVAEICAHAPEIIQDESGEWFISSTDYPYRGINIAPFEWK